MKKQTTISDSTKKLCGIAAFSSLAYVITLIIHIPIPVLTFNFTLDFKDALICIASFLYGPVSGIVISFISAFIEFVSISETGVHGLVMNFLSSAAFSFVASFIYTRRKTLNTAIIGLYAGVATMTAVMIGLNLIITPLYTGLPVSAVVSIIPTVLLPFNLAKGLANGAVALVLYKPVVIAMRRAGLVSGGRSAKSDSSQSVASSDGELKERRLYSESYSPDKFSRRSILTIIFGGLTLAAAIVIFLIIT